MRYRVSDRFKATDIRYVHIQPTHCDPRSTEGETLLPSKVWQDAGYPEELEIFAARQNVPSSTIIRPEEMDRLVDAVLVAFQHRNFEDDDVLEKLLKSAIRAGFIAGRKTT